MINVGQYWKKIGAGDHFQVLKVSLGSCTEKIYGVGIGDHFQVLKLSLRGKCLSWQILNGELPSIKTVDYLGHHIFTPRRVTTGE